MAIEAALVVPLLMILVFGMIEMAFAVRDYASVASLARSGVRIAATGADRGPATTECGTADPDLPPCAPASTPMLAQMAADAIQRAGSAMPSNQIETLLVYKANADGMPGSLKAGDEMPRSCPAGSDCVRFVWQPAPVNGFRSAGGTWTASKISACFPGTGAHGLDSVGVHVSARHEWMSGFADGALTISDHSVMRFEPLPVGSCNGQGVGNGGHS